MTMESTFWVWPLPEKTPEQIKLEARVFGCDDLWRHIKTFIFSPRECRYNKHFNGREKGMALIDTPCSGELIIDQLFADDFMHVRQGISEEKRERYFLTKSVLGRFRLVTYTCEGHKHCNWEDVEMLNNCCVT